MKKPHRYLTLGLLVLAVGIWFVRPAVAKPPISWTPASVVQAIVVGEEPVQVSVSFTSDSDLGSVEVRVVPELEAFVAVVPDEPFEVAAGETVTLALSLSADNLDFLGPVDGVLQVRNASGPAQTHARPLPIQLDVQPFPLPPDPGEAGKEALEGIDSDEDGVRDDVQRWIAFSFHDVPTLAQDIEDLARAAQDVLLASTDEETAAPAIRDVLHVASCLRIQNPDTYADLSDDVIRMVANTFDRVEARLATERLVSGESFDVLGLDELAPLCQS